MIPFGRLDKGSVVFARQAQEADLQRCYRTAFSVDLCAKRASGPVRVPKWYDDDPFNCGIGHDHDMNDRLPLGLSLRVIPSIQGWLVNYRSAFHFSDNKSASFYMGPTIGKRSLGSYGTQVP